MRMFRWDGFLAFLPIPSQEDIHEGDRHSTRTITETKIFLKYG